MGGAVMNKFEHIQSWGERRIWLSVCLNAINSKTTERIYMRISPNVGMIHEESLGDIHKGFV